MTYKKTWFSYILWAIYTCIMGVMLANYTILLWKNEIDIAVGYGTVFFVFLAFALTVGGYFLLRKLLHQVRDKIKIRERTALLWEIFIVLSIFTAALLYRVYLCAQGAHLIRVTPYYDLATVKAGDSVEPMLHGASYLYTLCLSFVFSFLGNKAQAAVWFQIFLQMATLLPAFFSVRKMAGKIPAYAAMCVLAFSTGYAGRIFEMTPECLFFLLYLTGLYIVGSYARNFNRYFHGTGSAVCGALVSGLVTGILSYLDASAVTLAVWFIPLLCGVCQREETVRISFSLRLFLFMSALLFTVLAFMGMFVLDAGVCQLPMGEVTRSWFALYAVHLPVDYLLYQTDISLWECFVPVILSSWLVMAFWNRKEEENAAPWILLMILLAPTPLARVGVLPYQVYAIFLWGVLAGIGLQQSFVIQNVVTEAPAAGTSAAETSVTQKVIMQAKEEEAAMPVQEETSKPAPVPRFLENPLPLPKKHEKRVMDYEYEVPEEKMKFDIECTQDDDFDLNE